MRASTGSPTTPPLGWISDLTCQISYPIRSFKLGDAERCQRLANIVRCPYESNLCARHILTIRTSDDIHTTTFLVSSNDAGDRMPAELRSPTRSIEAVESAPCTLQLQHVHVGNGDTVSATSEILIETTTSPTRADLRILVFSTSLCAVSVMSAAPFMAQLFLTLSRPNKKPANLSYELTAQVDELGDDYKSRQRLVIESTLPPIDEGSVYRGTMQLEGVGQGSDDRREVICKIAEDRKPIMHLRNEAAFYQSELKALQGVLVPHFVGFFRGSVDGFPVECMVLEYCGEPPVSHDPIKPDSLWSLDLDIKYVDTSLHLRSKR